MKISSLFGHVAVAALIAWILGGIITAYLATGTEATSYAHTIGYGMGYIAGKYWYVLLLVGAGYAFVRYRFFSSAASHGQ